MRGRAARRSEVSKQARLVERQVCFASGAGSWGGEGGGQLSTGRLLRPPQKQRRKAFVDRAGGWGGCRSSAAVPHSHRHLAISGLSSIILAALGALNLQFWGVSSIQSLSCVWLFGTP